MSLILHTNFAGQVTYSVYATGEKPADVQINNNKL